MAADFVLSLAVVLLALALLVAGILHCLREEEPAGWLLLQVALPIAGPLLYFVAYYVAMRGLATKPQALAPPMAPRLARKRIGEVEPRLAAGIRIPVELRDLGHARFIVGDHTGAIAALTEYLEASPGDLRSRYFLGQSLLHEKRYKDAIEAFQDVVAAEQGIDSGQGLVLLGRAFAAHGDRERAQLCFETAVSVSRSVEARLELADMLAADGNLDAARKLLREIVEDARMAPPFQRRQARYWARQAKRRQQELDKP